MSKALFMAAAAGAGGVAKTYVDDVFSTYLYEGADATQTITNGIDLAGNGGLVWTKARNITTSHYLVDSARNNFISTLQSNEQNAEETGASFTANSNGYSIGVFNRANLAGGFYASWTFRKAPKFFDVVTYTGTGSNRTIAHSLGVAPGCIMVKRTDTSSDWQVYHRSLGSVARLCLNSTAGQSSDSTFWNSTDPTSSVFSLGTNADVNANGGTYVAYLFAHDTDTVDGLIQCGGVSYTGTLVDVNLGWEPQYLIWRNASSTQSWSIFDTMRGWATDLNNANSLLANLSSAESSGAGYFTPTATGMRLGAGYASGTYIYIAIRRPNKPPTTGAEVFAPQVTTDSVNAANPRVLPIPASDMWIDTLRTGTSRYNASRLTGWEYLLTDTTDAENTSYNWTQDTQTLLNPQTGWWSSPASQIVYHFKRAPGFFDVVAYAGTGANRTVAHNLGIAPELMIVKLRSGGGIPWAVYHSAVGAANFSNLNTTAGSASGATYWNSTNPTASVFSVGTNDATNAASSSYIAYLFATLAGISKVGSYTGNGSNQTINCGFTTGARFVLIKRTDSTGDWFVWDTARGIVSGNDPHLSLNTATAEVTTNDTIDPDTSGFIVNQVAATNVNVNAATYIYLAIA